MSNHLKQPCILLAEGTPIPLRINRGNTVQQLKANGKEFGSLLVHTKTFYS
jgi:hypothetical protein